MRGRSLVVEWQEGDTVAALKAAYRAEQRPEQRSRLQGLWLLRAGWQLAAVAEVVGVNYRTVQQWLAWYRTGGRAEVLRHQRGGKGKPAFLTPAQQAELANEVATGRFRTAAEIRAWIQTQYGVTFTVGSIYTLMQRLKCGPKVPRPVHEKADLAAQDDWKKGGLPKQSSRRA